MNLLTMNTISNITVRSRAYIHTIVSRIRQGPRRDAGDDIDLYNQQVLIIILIPFLSCRTIAETWRSSKHWKERCITRDPGLLSRLVVPTTHDGLLQQDHLRFNIILWEFFQRFLWEREQLARCVDFSQLQIDPAPFQLVERTSLYKVRFKVTTKLAAIFREQ